MFLIFSLSPKSFIILGVQATADLKASVSASEWQTKILPIRG